MKLKTSKLVLFSLICFPLLGTMSIVNEISNADNNKNSFNTRQGRLSDPVGYNSVKSWYFGQQPKTNFNIEISLDSNLYNYLRLWLLERINHFLPFSASEKTMQDFVTSFVTGTDTFGWFTQELKTITKQLQLKLEEKSKAASLRQNFFQDSLANWLTTVDDFGYFVSAFTVNSIITQGANYDPTLNLLWRYGNGINARGSNHEEISNYYRQKGMCIEIPFVDTKGDLWEIDKTNLRTFPQDTKNLSVNHYYLQEFSEGIEGPEIYIKSKSTDIVYVKDVLLKIIDAMLNNFGLQIKDMEYIKIDSKDWDKTIPTNKTLSFANVSLNYLNTSDVSQTYISLPILLARYAPSFV